MNILKNILIIVLIIILIIIFIVLLILIIPFKYSLNVSYEEDKKAEIDFKYIIFRIKGHLLLKPKVKLQLKLWNKDLVDTEKSKKDEKKLLEKKDTENSETSPNNSIEKTDFILHKGIENNISARENKLMVKNLFSSAKKFEKNNNKNLALVEIDDKKKNQLKNKADSFIDKFKNIFSENITYVMKLVVNQGINALNVIKPSTVNVNIKYPERNPFALGLAHIFLAPVYAIVGDDLRIRPSRDVKYYTADLKLSSNVMLIKLVPPIINLLKDERFRDMFLKKKDKGKKYKKDN